MQHDFGIFRLEIETINIILLFKIKSLNVIEGCQMLSFNERYIIFTNCVFKFEFIKVYLEININLFIFLTPFKINKCTNGHEQIYILSSYLT